MSQVVGVVGASARAAVHSLARAGFCAWTVDLFGDRDLKRIAPCSVCPVDRYPDAIPELAAQFPTGPVLYTGGLENYPHILRQLSDQRELWGNPPEVVARVRDPFKLFSILANAGFAVPRLVPTGEPCPTEERWLRKPLRSGGGLGIRFAQPSEVASQHHYFQEFIAGSPMSALFINSALCGITEQLIGESWLHAKPFAYCGNIASVQLDATVSHWGNILCENTGLRGISGIDYLLTDAGACVLEVNPRYTAAVEVLEHAIGIVPLAVANKRSWEEGDEVSWHCPAPSRQLSVIGKAIYYAPHTITFPQSGPWDADLVGEFDPWRLPQFADIPEPGCMIEAGSPILTFFAKGNTSAEVRERLQSRAGELDKLFYHELLS